ncbi:MULTISPECIES: class A sortase [Limosilactobacillus]|uniref:Class A sortase n=2 Tax=Limosilactobacillus pontis TaxID=35787 RepID=A0ABU7SS29_9LACO|nr:class A sortase [Limosilactobacillus pontis]KRM37357.1 sortase family protein [Limosilactobacillus pontis DSM 8475]QFV00463.1 sortase [Limosilactobacillus pontis]
MKKQQRSRGWLRWVAIVILLVVSVCLIFNQQIKEHLVGSYRPTITRQSIKQDRQKKATYNFNDVKDLNFQTVAQARAKKQPINIIGEITVPAIDMTLPIANGVNNTTLALATGTMRPDMQMGQGNYALAGHNMANGSKILFSPLYYHAKVGQMVYITDLDRVYEYRISQRQFIDATDVQVVNNTPQKIITLITCDATGARRLMIRGDFVKSEPFKQAPTKVQKNFSTKYTTGRAS